LEDEDVIFLQEVKGRVGHVGKGLAVRRNSISVTMEKNRMKFRLIDGAVNLGKKTDTVPHGDLILRFLIMPLEIAQAIHGRGGIGIGIIQFPRFRPDNFYLCSLIDDTKLGGAALLVFEKLKLIGSLFWIDDREFQLRSLDRIPFRRFSISGCQVSKRAVLEIKLNDPRPRSKLKLIDALDFGVFFGDVVRPDLLKGTSLKKGKNKQDADKPAEK
jgi:hypothetical protein